MQLFESAPLKAAKWPLRWAEAPTFLSRQKAEIWYAYWSKIICIYVG